MGLSQFDETRPFVQSVNIPDYLAATRIQLPAPADDRWRYDGMIVTTTETVDRIFALYLLDGGAHLRIWSQNIPAGSGHGGLPAVDVIASMIVAGLTFPVITHITQVELFVEAAITSGKAFDVVAFGGSV